MSKKKFEATAVKTNVLVSPISFESKGANLYRVVLFNDDYTSMNFVVEILQKFFSMETAKATRTMLTVHKEGRAICGTYTKDIAETKVTMVNQCSRMNQYPLLCCMEKI